MTTVQKKMNIWWVLLLLHATAIFWLSYFGVFTYIASVDHTYISFINIAIYVVSFLFIGWKLKNESYNSLEEDLYPVWFASEQVLGLGMLGTVLGFVFMLSTATTVPDPSQLSGLLQQMSQYLGLAFMATATGLVASILLRTWVVLFTRLDA